MSESIRRQTDLSWPLFYDGPFWYTQLREPDLSRELKRLALGVSPFDNVDCATFQPCPDPDIRNEDRWAAERWEMPDGQWTCLGVFDGHGGSETAAYTAKHLPSLIQSRLASLISEGANRAHAPEVVSELIRTAIQDFDNSLLAGLKSVFPEHVDDLERMSDAEVRGRLSSDMDGSKRSKVVRCMRGTTVLVAIADPTKRNVYVSSLGDSTAVLGTLSDKGAINECRVVSRAHNPIAEEAQRISEEHPGEDAILSDRILGTLAVTRSIGDHVFKLPAVYTRKVFGNVENGMRSLGPVLDRIRTPPYISAEAHVEHVMLPEDPLGETVLILASDGLQALSYDGRVDAAAWVRSAVRPASDDERAAGWEDGACRSLNVLRDAMGGRDGECVSATLTVEMMEKWCDDVTVVIQKL